MLSDELRTRIDRQIDAYIADDPLPECWDRLLKDVSKSLEMDPAKWNALFVELRHLIGS